MALLALPCGVASFRVWSRALGISNCCAPLPDDSLPLKWILVIRTRSVCLSYPGTVSPGANSHGFDKTRTADHENRLAAWRSDGPSCV
jgi:hypothetical protein